MLLLEGMSHQADHGHATADLRSSAMRERRTDDVSALESTAVATEVAHADAIAARTRTKLSLVDVPMDTLEASLVDAAPLALGGHVCSHVCMYPCTSLRPLFVVYRISRA